MSVGVSSKIDLAIITAPRRKSTITDTAHSIRSAKFDGIIQIFAEPDTIISLTKCYIHRNQWKYGAFKNFHQALSWMVENSDKKYIMISGDDFKFARTAFHEVIKLAEKLDDFGYLSMFTPVGMSHYPEIRDGWNQFNYGWKKAYGGQYLFRRSTAEKIIESDFYLDHLENYEKNEQIDHAIPAACYELKLAQWYRVPSLCDHIGRHSTLGHDHTALNRGLKFRLS